MSDREVVTFLDDLTLFGMGYSWGGLREPRGGRSIARPTVRRRRGSPGGRGIRLNIGLEAPEDLIADLDAALDAMIAVKA